VRCCQTALARRLDVVVTDLSRLSRSQGDLSKVIDRLVVKGIRVIGVQDSYMLGRRGDPRRRGEPATELRAMRAGTPCCPLGARRAVFLASPTAGRYLPLQTPITRNAHS